MDLEATDGERRVSLAVASHVLLVESSTAKGSRRLEVLSTTSFPTNKLAIERLSEAAGAGLCGVPPVRASQLLADLQRVNEKAAATKSAFAVAGQFDLVDRRSTDRDDLGLSTVVFDHSGTG